MRTPATCWRTQRPWVAGRSEGIPRTSTIGNNRPKTVSPTAEITRLQALVARDGFRTRADAMHDEAASNRGSFPKFPA